MGLASTMMYTLRMASAADCGLSMVSVMGTWAPLSARCGPLSLMTFVSSIARLGKNASFTTGHSLSEASAMTTPCASNMLQASPAADMYLPICISFPRKLLMKYQFDLCQRYRFGSLDDAFQQLNL